MRSAICFSICLLFVLPFSLATTYNGAGNYTLSPGDIIIFNEGYVVKYFNYQENVQFYWLGEQRTGNLATMTLFNSTANLSYYGENIYAIDIFSSNKDKIQTFSNGFWFYVDALKENSQQIRLEVYIGGLSTCTDTDAYSVGNSALETSTGKWGRNYYKKGLTTENKEDINGQTETKKEDVCSNNKLTEYYCDNNELKSEIKKCKCLDDGACKKGFFDAISEWLGRTFGYLN